MLSKILDLLEDLTDKDCYDRISASSKPRELEKTEYQKRYGVAVADLECMMTGISHNKIITADNALPISSRQPKQPNNPVTLAHLLARCADATEAAALGYGINDVENIRNSLLLCKNIEIAFDKKYISFVPSDNPFSNNRYKLHVWLDMIKSTPIFEGATQTIGDLHGKPLNLTVGQCVHDPFKRALSFQTLRAFKKWRKGLNLGINDLPCDCDTSVYEGSYKREREKLLLQLYKDIADDEEDDDTWIIL